MRNYLLSFSCRFLVPYGLFGLLVLALYSPALSYGFVTDDFYFARPLTRSQLLSTFYANWDPWGHANAHYRPIVALSFAFDYAIWGPRPYGYHLTNLVLMWLNGIAAFELLRRLGASILVGCIATLVWLAHPLSATAAAWSNQRTDSIMALFFLLALTALMRPMWRPMVDSLFVLVLAGLAFGSKEMSVTLPVVAVLLLVVFRPSNLRSRLIVAVALAVIVVLYALWWISWLPGKAGAVDLGGLAGLPRLVVPVFAPGTYLSWWEGRLESLPTVAGGLLLLVSLIGLTRGRPSRDLYLAGYVWPVVTMIPIFGLRDPDIYRLGFLVAFGLALVVAGLGMALEKRTLIVLALAALLLLWLAPVARASAASWGQRGFMYQAGLHWKLNDPNWESRLSPEMQRLFRRQARMWGPNP